MRTFLLGGIATSMTAILLTAGTASAWELTGKVVCDGTGQPLAGVQIDVVTTDGGDPFYAGGATDQNGNYSISLVDSPRCYRATASLNAGESVVTPASGYHDFCTTNAAVDVARDWVVNSPSCTSGACWLTGGGAKFSSITDSDLGEAGKRHNWGGNVNPGCSPTAGDGGSWNDIDAIQKLHFHGTHIEVVRCGNVDGIPPGSTSPPTPFNYIEFTGWGTLKGIQGNKADYGTVYFFARCEDRNEPGSNGQHDGAGKDRYFLNVYTDPGDPVGTSVMLVDVDGDPATVDPLIITDGNLQIHVSSCDVSILVGGVPDLARLTPLPGSSTIGDGAAWLAPAAPNPTGTKAAMRFGVPRSANVSLRVFDASGRAVRELVGGYLPAGRYSASWDLNDGSGHRVSRGVYFLRLSHEGTILTRSITVTR